MTTPAETHPNATEKLQSWNFELTSLDDTMRLAHAIADISNPGLCVLLNGPVGAGKSYLSRGVIQTLMRRNGNVEDVPSPTFTLVQSYELDCLEVWHADLYRLTGPDELFELGLEQAFESAMCLIEWPDRLGDMRPKTSIEITLSPDPSDLELRSVQIVGPSNIISKLQSLMENSIK